MLLLYMRLTCGSYPERATSYNFKKKSVIQMDSIKLKPIKHQLRSKQNQLLIIIRSLTNTVPSHKAFSVDPYMTK